MAPSLSLSLSLHLCIALLLISLPRLMAEGMENKEFEYKVAFVSPGSLGIVFEPTSSGGVRVRELVPNGMAASTKKVEIGDRLTEFNGEDVSRMAHSDVMKMIPAAPWPRVLRFIPYKGWDRNTLGQEQEVAPPPPTINVESANSGTLTVTEPAIISGVFPSMHADFGSMTPPCTAVNVSIASPMSACSALLNPEEVKGTYAVVARGTCTFWHKAKNALDAGAAGVLVLNSDKTGVSVMPAGPFPTVDFVHTPVVMLEKSAGVTLTKLAPIMPVKAILHSATTKEVCGKGGVKAVEVAVDGTIVGGEEVDETEIRTEKSGKRTNPSKPGLCEVHVWTPTKGLLVLKECATAIFGDPMPKFARPIVFGGVGCDNISASAFGNIVVVERGGYAFGNKALLAQSLGAGAIIVTNKGNRGVLRMPAAAPDPTIPGVMISDKDGDTLKAFIENEPAAIGRIFAKGYQ